MSFDAYIRGWGASQNAWDARQDTQDRNRRRTALEELSQAMLTSGDVEEGSPAWAAFNAGEYGLGREAMAFDQQQQDQNAARAREAAPVALQAFQSLQGVPAGPARLAMAQSYIERFRQFGMPVDEWAGQIDMVNQPGFLESEIAELQGLGFGQPSEPMEINNQLIDPRTYAVLGDYRDPDDRVSSTSRARAEDRDAGRYEFRRPTADEAAQLGVSPDQVLRFDRRTGDVEIADFGAPSTEYEDRVIDGRIVRTMPDGSTQTLYESPADARDASAANDMIARAERVVGELDEIIRTANSSNTGSGGGLGSRIPGTPAHDLRAMIETVTANIAFDELQRMRQNSPTGGALGSVSERELDLLGAALGSLRQTQSIEQFRRNVMNVRRHYQRAIDALRSDIAQDTSGPNSGGLSASEAERQWNEIANSGGD